MIFHSRNRTRGTSNWFANCVPLIPVIVLAFCIYAFIQSFNTDSWFCSYQIYKQTDGTYQVWWSCRTKHLEGTFKTYQDAKAFQIKENQELIDFMSKKPTGERSK